MKKLQIGKTYTVKAGWTHNFKDGEQVVIIKKFDDWGYIAKSLDPNTTVGSPSGKGTQLIEASDVYGEVN